MMFIALKTEDGVIKGKLSFYCRMLNVTWQGFYKYLANKDRPWKYEALADAMGAIVAEDVCNDTYGRIRMYQALQLKQPEGIRIPGERTVYRVMEENGLSHRPKRRPNGITKADRQARKSDDLLKRDFTSAEPFKKCVTDITEIKAKKSGGGCGQKTGLPRTPKGAGSLCILRTKSTSHYRFITSAVL